MKITGVVTMQRGSPPGADFEGLYCHARYQPEIGAWEIRTANGRGITLPLGDAVNMASAILDRAEGVDDLPQPVAPYLDREIQRLRDAGEDTGHLVCNRDAAVLRYRLRRMVKRYMRLLAEFRRVI